MTFKSDTKKADFLDMIKNPRHRIATNNFRLGNHLLRIEAGRRIVPKTPEDLRLCHVCQTNEVKNELHFLFSCTPYDNLHIKLFNELTEKYIFLKIWIFIQKFCFFLIVLILLYVNQLLPLFMIV